jgi:protein-S-isoprenylcysteine O-methyltransferase Ste14
MGRITSLAYGVVCRLILLGTFLYAVGFVGNLAVPKAIDSGPVVQPGEAVAVNVLLLGLFAAQHSVMACPLSNGGGPGPCRRTSNAAPTSWRAAQP